MLPCTIVNCVGVANNWQRSALQIALVLIDEVHLLSDSRGVALETGVVSRIKMVSKDTGMQEVRSCALVLHSVQTEAQCQNTLASLSTQSGALLRQVLKAAPCMPAVTPQC